MNNEEIEAEMEALDRPIQDGIDGVYHNPEGQPKYIIAESRYESTPRGNRLRRLQDGTKRMSHKWIFNSARLEEAVGKEMAREIRKEVELHPENVEVHLLQISPDGSVEQFTLDVHGNKIQNRG